MNGTHINVRAPDLIPAIQKTAEDAGVSVSVTVRAALAKIFKSDSERRKLAERLAIGGTVTKAK